MKIKGVMKEQNKSGKLSYILKLATEKASIENEIEEKKKKTNKKQESYK